MSWDVMIHRFEGPPPRVEDIVDAHLFLPLGEAGEVRSRISAILPEVDWTDPAWGVLRGEGFSIEFNFQAEGLVDGFMLHVRGEGDPVRPVVALCAANGWAALDTSAGAFIDLENPSRAGWESFQTVRDQVARRIRKEELRSWLGRLWRRFAQ